VAGWHCRSFQKLCNARVTPTQDASHTSPCGSDMFLCAGLSRRSASACSVTCCRLASLILQPAVQCKRHDVAHKPPCGIGACSFAGLRRRSARACSMTCSAAWICTSQDIDPWLHVVLLLSCTCRAQTEICQGLFDDLWQASVGRSFNQALVQQSHCNSYTFCLLHFNCWC
jgi:hypothetical protein